ncbi:MAG: hypothetical protein IKL13_01005 [Clostridia bacterium]|nr:hypothetical protein [Clostridia bacterium]
MFFQHRDSQARGKGVSVKLIAIGTAVVLLLGLVLILLGGGTPKSAAKKYVRAQIEGDAKAMYRVMAGKMQKYNEALFEDGKEEMFSATEEACKEMGIQVDIRNFNQYYKAGKQLSAAQLEDQYGKGYKLTVKVREIEDMSMADLKRMQERCTEEDLADYIRADKIKKGKCAIVDVIIEGTKETTTQNVRVYVVKYKGKWKVANF